MKFNALTTVKGAVIQEFGVTNRYNCKLITLTETKLITTFAIFVTCVQIVMYKLQRGEIKSELM